jgi:hypothetical protein
VNAALRSTRPAVTLICEPHYFTGADRGAGQLYSNNKAAVALLRIYKSLMK